METIPNDRLRKSGIAGIALAAVLVGAFMLVTPMKSFAQVNDLAVQAYDDCTLRDLHEDPIDMNTVAGTKGATPIAKTVHAEKQVYDCYLVQGNVPVIVDQTIFLYIYENMATKAQLRKYAEVITCVKKGSDALVLGCTVEKPSTDPIVTQECEELTGIEHPQEMTTVVSATDASVIKTTEAQKEVFQCFEGETNTGWLKKVDVVIFTSIWQDLDLLNGNTINKRQVTAAICVVNLDEGVPTDPSDGRGDNVESCRFVNVSL
ncbi:MAG: hypothetical protein QXU32_02770 [Nitrososphaerales archaeon]